MNKFRNAYQKAVDAMPVPQFSADNMQMELHRRRMQEQRRNRMLARGCAAAVIFLLCGVGTATAKNYIGSTIEVGGNGFTMTDSADAGQEGISEMGGGLSLEEIDSEEELIVEETLTEETVYANIEMYQAQSKTAGKLPELSFLKEIFPDTEVGVLDDDTNVSVRLWTEERFFFLMQFDHREASGYGSATAYTGKSVNERNYINSQGLNYVVFDTMGEDGEIESTHAVISVNGRDLTLDFGGFEEDEIKHILNQLDLTFYFCE